MGSYLGKAGSSPRSPAQGRADSGEKPASRRPARPLYQVHRVQHVHRAQPARRHRPARRPPNWDPANPTAFVSEAWRRFPMKRPQNPIMGSLPSDWWESYLKRNIWSLRHPRATWSPVTVKISPPERRPRPLFPASRVVNSAGPSEEPPGPCGKDPVLRALLQCRKGRARWEEPLFPDSSDSQRHSATVWSAFKPLLKSGATVSFVARPGSLKRRPHVQSSDHNCKRASCSSVALVASIHTRGPPSTKRNAITSSYSSSRELSGSWKRHFPRTLVQTPEWPLKKAGESPNSHLSVTPSSSGQLNGEIPLLQSGPRDLLTKPCQQGSVVTEEDPALEGQAVPSNQTTDATTGTARDSIPEMRAGIQPTLSLIRSSSETVLRTHVNPRLESLKNMPAPHGCSQLEHIQGISSDSNPSIASTQASPSSPTTPVTDSTWPSSIPQAHRSAVPPHSSVIKPTAPTTQSTLVGVVSNPTLHLPASVLPVETSSHLALRPIWGPVHSTEVRTASYSRISVMAEASSSSSPSTTPGILRPTFKPIFGSIKPLQTMSETAPVSTRQPSSSLSSDSTHLFHSLATTAPCVVTSAIPASKSKDPGVDFNIVTSTTGNSCSVPSCSTFLLGASQNFPSATDLIFPSQHPTIPTVHTVTIFSQVLTSAIKISPLRSTDTLKEVSNPLATLSLSSTNQPPVTSSNSNVTSALTSSLGSSPKPLLPPSQRNTSQHSPGAIDGLKQSSLQLAPAQSFSTSFLSENSGVSPTPSAQLVLSKTTQPACGQLTSSAPIIHTPATSQPSFGSTLAGFPLSKASSTALRVIRQNHQSVTYSSVFGSTAPRPFAFGGLVTPMDCGEPEVIVAAPKRSTSGTRQSMTPSTLAPFVQCWNQSMQGPPNQITPLAGIPARKIMSGAPSLVPFAQSIPVPGAIKAGSNLGFGLSSPTVQGSMGRNPFRSLEPSFCIGTKSKTLRNREPGRSRKHHTYKK
ncbi:POM121-like protein 2 isoform X1 [Mus caroli]|uniref:POM121-like protein 2 isoform X1 n=1 Tax=Mus caroli TaxID=10089 RepID=A0A6P5QXN9_MUSCR|nr:POM121-like protein 2 isoform X1 [Mus caroli]